MEKKLANNLEMTGMLKALLAAYLTTIILLLGLAFGLYRFDLSEQAVQGGILAVYVLSAFIGGRIAGKMAGHRRFFWGMLVGLLYFAMLILISLLAYQSVAIGGGIAVSALLCVAGGMLGGMLS